MEGEREGFSRSFEKVRLRYPQAAELWREQMTALMHAEQWHETLRVIAEGRALLGDLPIFAAHEAVVYAETGQAEIADRLLAPFASSDDPPLQVRRVRHYLRSGRPELAGQIIDDWLQRPEAFMFYPYASIAWRLIDVPRWEWLEADESFVGIYDIADQLPPLDIARRDSAQIAHRVRTAARTIVARGNPDGWGYFPAY